MSSKKTKTSNMKQIHEIFTKITNWSKNSKLFQAMKFSLSLLLLILQSLGNLSLSNLPALREIATPTLLPEFENAPVVSSLMFPLIATTLTPDT